MTNENDETNLARPAPSAGGGVLLGYLLTPLTASVDGYALLQPRHFVRYQQLATLQLYVLQVVDRRMRARLADFLFQRTVPSLQFRKMRFYGHMGWSPRQIDA